MLLTESNLFGYSVSTDGGLATKDVVQMVDFSRPKGSVKYNWIHIQGDPEYIINTLKGANLPALTVNALGAEETRPRCTPQDNGAIVILRGVNLNEGAQAEDMISIRIWVEENRVISCGLRPLAALDDVVSRFRENRPPESTGDFIAVLALHLADKAEPVIAELNEQIDTIEESIADRINSDARKSTSNIRRVAILIRRYLFPQRDALSTLEIAGFSWMETSTLNHLREATERVSRFCEDLDSIRDRAQVIHDQVMDERAENLNRQMLILTIVAAFFLPIGFLTGLLGMNVGGLPFSDSPLGFTYVIVAILAILVIEYFIFKKLKLI